MSPAFLVAAALATCTQPLSPAEIGNPPPKRTLAALQRIRHAQRIPARRNAFSGRSPAGRSAVSKNSRPLHRAVATVSREEENAQQAVLWHLLTFFPEPYAMLFAYQDESCIHNDAVAMGVAGVLFSKKSLEAFDRRWRRELKKAGIRYFHKADSAGRRGEFKGASEEFTDQLYRKLVPIVVECVLGSITVCSIPRGEFDAMRAMQWRYSPYTIASLQCVFSILELAKLLGRNQVSFVAESGHENMGELATAVKAKRAIGWPGVAGFGFQGKTDLHALAAADVMAYETTKRLKDRLQGSGRRLRASMRIIIGGNHHHRIQLVPPR